MRVTRILATAGPACTDVATLVEMIRAGADAFRLNTSVGTLDSHRRRIADIRRAFSEVGRPADVLIDLQGQKVRLYEVADGVTLEEGRRVRLCGGEGASTADEIRVDHDGVAAEVDPGDRIRLLDGSVELVVEARQSDHLVCRVVAGGALRSRCGAAFPDSALSLPALNATDVQVLDALDLAQVDAVALSLVARARDVRDLRDELSRRGAACRIVAKIERPRALRHLAAITREADEVLVARGDLGAELGLEAVPPVQKDICAVAAHEGRPVILATHLLESMIRAPKPTRAEVNDVANAVWEGVATLCLTAETAVGAHPVEVVRMMDRVIRAAEAYSASKSEWTSRR